MSEVRQATAERASNHLNWIRNNLAYAKREAGVKDFDLQFHTGISPQATRDFLTKEVNSGILNVLLIAEVLNLTLCDLDRSPAEFVQWWKKERGEKGPS